MHHKEIWVQIFILIQLDFLVNLVKSASLEFAIVMILWALSIKIHFRLIENFINVFLKLIIILKKTYTHTYILINILLRFYNHFHQQKH